MAGQFPHNSIMRPLSPLQQAAAVALGCLAVLALPIWQVWRLQPPDFDSFPAGDARKTAFFSYLGPIVDSENARWAERRQRLLELKKTTGSWSKVDRVRLNELIDLFEPTQAVNESALIDALLRHVDTIPRALVLAQAAKESAWGTSRFSAEGNNYFGQRCYAKGCGMVPGARASGAKFEVRRFESAAASVTSYMNNINGHREYQELREYRSARRRQNEPFTGIDAAERITQYSERRQAYVDEIQSLIHFNNLDTKNPEDRE